MSWIDSRTPGIAEYAPSGDIMIFKAMLLGLGLVSSPAYTESVVSLRRGGGGRFYYGRERTVSDRGKQRKEKFSRKCFERTFKEGRDVLLYAKTTREGAIASSRQGSLILTDTDDYLQFEVAEFVNVRSAASDFVDQAEAGVLDFGVVPLFTVPPYDDAYTDVEEAENPGVFVREYRDVILRGLLITDTKGVNEDFSDVYLRARRMMWR